MGQVFLLSAECVSQYESDEIHPVRNGMDFCVYSARGVTQGSPCEMTAASSLCGPQLRSGAANAHTASRAYALPSGELSAQLTEG